MKAYLYLPIKKVSMFCRLLKHGNILLTYRWMNFSLNIVQWKEISWDCFCMGVKLWLRQTK